MCKHQRWLAVLAVFAVAGLNAPVVSGAIVVDGGLADWGVTVADNNASTWGVAYTQGTNVTGDTIFGGNRIFYNIEDTNDNSNSYDVGPNSGGQNYDAEFLAVIYEATGLKIAVVSGQRPDNGASLFAPGDIRITSETGAVFGIEVGGSYDIVGGVVEGELGATYTLNGSGYTTAVSATGLVGDIFKDGTWIDDPIAPQVPTQIDHLAAGTNIGTADFFYSANTLTSQHSIIELSIDFASLTQSMGKISSIEWRPSCGNDELMVDVSTFSPQDNPVPEPSTLAIWGLGGLLCLFVARRRRRS